MAEAMEDRRLDLLAVTETHIPFGSLVGDVVSHLGNRFAFLGPVPGCSPLDSSSTATVCWTTPLR